MTHSHTHQGQSLVHDHDGGDKPHGYFQHSEDVGLPEPSSPVRSAGDAHEHDWPNAEQNPHDVCSICGKTYVQFHDELVANGIPIPYDDQLAPEDEAHILEVSLTYMPDQAQWVASVVDLTTTTIEHSTYGAAPLDAVMALAEHLSDELQLDSFTFKEAKRCVSRLRRRVAIAEGLALSDIEGNDWDDYDDQVELPGEVLRDGLS